MHSVFPSCTVWSCTFFASFLPDAMSILTDGVHHGGRGYGLMVSRDVLTCCGKLLVMCSNVEMWTALLEVMALLIVWLIGCFSGAVCIRMKDCNILLRSRR